MSTRWHEVMANGMGNIGPHQFWRLDSMTAMEAGRAGVEMLLKPSIMLLREDWEHPDQVAEYLNRRPAIVFALAYYAKQPATGAVARMVLEGLGLSPEDIEALSAVVSKDRTQAAVVRVRNELLALPPAASESPAQPA